MAFRMSDRDKAAIQAAAAIRQSNQAQADYDALMPQAMAKINQAQQGPSNPLESVLSGIGNSVKNVGTGLMDLFGTGGAAFGDLAESIRTGKATTKNQDDYRKWLYNTDSVKDAAAKGLGTGLDAAATLTDFIPGLGTAAKVGLNIGQGVASGIANPLIEKGSQATLEDAMKGALVGGASAGVGQYVGGKLANRAAGKGIVSKALNSNVGKGAITGGLAGAAGGGLYAGLNNGDVLQGALQGAQGGAMAGGTMAGAMGVLGSGIDRLNRKLDSPPQTPDVQTPKPIVDEVAEQYTKPATIETALQESQTPTRRQIDVQYDGSGNGNVAVNRQRKNMYRLPDRSGSTLDGVLGPNNKLQLPNAQKPTNPYAKMTDIEVLNEISPSGTGKMYTDLADAIESGDFLGNDPEGILAFLKEELPTERYNAIRSAIDDRVELDNMFSNEAYGIRKSDLPMLNRDEYYYDTIGRLGNKGNGNMRAEDVPKSMYNRLRNSAGRNSLGGSMTDNENIMREAFGDIANGKDKYELYDMYQQIAEAPGPRKYNVDDIVAAVTNTEYNDNIGDKALNDIVSPFRQDAQPTSRQIGVQSAPSIADSIDVSSPNRGQIIQDVMPAQRQAQPQVQPQVQAQPIQEAPAQAPVQRVRRAADTSDVKINPNLAPEDVARLERQLTVNRQKQGAALLDQYGTLDAPVRRAVGSPEDVLTTLYDDYGLKTPADVQYAANHVTGRNGVVSQMTRELAASANNVDTTITRDWLQELMDANGLLDDEQKTVTKQIAGALKRANSSSDGATTLDIMKQLEKQSARYKGKDGTYHHATEAETRKGIILDLVHDELQDRLWDAAGDPKKVLTPKRITELKSMYKDNDAWTNFIDNKLTKAKSGAELRSAMKPLVDGSKIVYGSKQSAGGFADRAYKAATSANPIVAMGQMAYDAALDSDKVKQIRASRYAKDAAKAKAQLTGQEAPKGNGIIGTAKNIGQKAVNKAGKAAEMLNNDTFSGREISPITRQGQTQTIGDVAMRRLPRQVALDTMREQDRQNAIQNATQEAQGIQSNYENSMLQAQQAYNQAQQTQNSIPSTLDRIGAGMERALAAGDINAYSTLADLYKQASQMYELQNPTATKSEAKALTSNQSKAMTGLQQLQTLSGMAPDLGTALASSPLGGLVNMAGGNDYANQAEALATTIGYLLSGATIKPDEAEKLGRGYVPSAYDSDQVRQQKLSRAEQLLRNYLADTSSLPQ